MEFDPSNEVIVSKLFLVGGTLTYQVSRKNVIKADSMLKCLRGRNPIKLAHAKREIA